MDLFRNAFAEKDKDEVKDKDKDRTKTKNEKDPTCSIFLESRGCNDIKYDLFTKSSSWKSSRYFQDIFENSS